MCEAGREHGGSTVGAGWEQGGSAAQPPRPPGPLPPWPSGPSRVRRAVGAVRTNQGS